MHAATSPHDFKLLVAADGRRGTTMDDLADNETRRAAVGEERPRRGVGPPRHGALGPAHGRRHAAPAAGAARHARRVAVDRHPPPGRRAPAGPRGPRARPRRRRRRRDRGRRPRGLGAGGPGLFLVFDPGERHEVRATTDARLRSCSRRGPATGTPAPALIPITSFGKVKGPMDPTAPSAAPPRSSAASGRCCSCATSPRARSRFCELERSLQGISPRTLSLRLRALEEEGIVERQTLRRGPAARRVRADREGPRAAADHRRHARVRPQLAGRARRLRRGARRGRAAPWPSARTATPATRAGFRAGGGTVACKPCAQRRAL